MTRDLMEPLDRFSPWAAVRRARITALVRAVRLSCPNEEKAQQFIPGRGSSGECQLITVQYTADARL